MFLLLTVVGWLYVTLMMAVAEANHPQGSVLGAMFTFLLYGAAPVALIVYLMGRPARRAARRRREQANEQQGSAGSGQPDAGGEAPADAVAAVRKEP
jgi:membrane protein implicated in regulation of membrane protease activity